MYVFLFSVRVNSNHGIRLKTRMSFFVWPSLFLYNTKSQFKLLRRNQRKTTKKSYRNQDRYFEAEKL